MGRQLKEGGVGMFKRIVAVLLALVFAATVVGCGKKEPEKKEEPAATATEGEKEGEKKPEAEKPAETEKDG